MSQNPAQKPKARTFDLPLPPTSNHRLMPIQKGGTTRLIKSPAYRQWMQAAVAELMQQNAEHKGGIFTEEVDVAVVAFFADKRKRDLDNLLKPVNDVLTQAAIIQDDSLICCEVVRRVRLAKGNQPRLSILVMPAEPWHITDLSPTVPVSKLEPLDLDDAFDDETLRRFGVN